MASPATTHDVTESANNVALNRHFDELMASQCAQTSDIIGSQSVHAIDLGSRINNTERFLNQAVEHTKNSIKDSGERNVIQLRDSVERNSDNINDHIGMTNTSVERAISCCLINLHLLTFSFIC